MNGPGPGAGRVWRGLFLALALVAAGPGAAAVSATASTPHVRAELVASADAVQPGGEILLGVRQRIIPHWHTYWKNPGDSGTPTRIDWTLPDGAVAGAIEWPAPRLIRLGPVSNYGYEGEVTLLSKVAVPAGLAPGSRFPVRAAVSWLVCEEECVPEDVELALTLPVVAAGADLGAGHPAVARAVAGWPTELPGTATVASGAVGDGALELRVDSLRFAAAAVTGAWFFPAQWGKIAQSAEQVFRLDGTRLTLKLRGGRLAPREVLDGVLVVEGSDGRAAYTVQAAPVAAGDRSKTAEGVAEGAAAEAAEAGDGWLPAILLALLGGLVLNLMPCVFPVLSIKALALLRHAEHSPRQQRLQGLAYTAGVLASFALLAAVLIVLRAAGQSIGWGFQYQSPVFVVVVAQLMFAVGLNLSGLFTFGAGVAGLGSGLAGKAGYGGSFFTGVLAAVVATPCTAPFMGAAVGYALGQPAPVLLAVFIALGAGLALPFLLLTLWPRLQRLLPKPGAWMERLKEALAFPMYAAAVWLVWVLAQQGGPNAVLVALVGMLLIGLAGWLHGLAHGATPVRWRVAAALTLALAVSGSGLGVDAVARPAATAAAATADEAQSWQPFAADRLAALREAGKPVFVNMTAAWCISCLVNERVALSDAAIVAAFQAGEVAYLKGDWTNRDEAITRYLQAFGRSGVPLYVYYPPGKDARPVVLPQLLTPDIVRQYVFSPASGSPTQTKESS